MKKQLECENQTGQKPKSSGTSYRNTKEKMTEILNGEA